MRWVRGASSNCSQSDRRLLFGVGNAKTVQYLSNGSFSSTMLGNGIATTTKGLNLLP